MARPRNPSLGRRASAEFLGTLLFVFVGAGSVIAVSYLGVGVQGSALLMIALANGLALAVAVSATMGTSGGHLNPAVTVGALIGGRIRAADALVYIVCQVLGATVAGFLLMASMPLAAGSAAAWGAPALGPQTAPLQGIILEAVTTFFLVMVVFGTAIDRKGPHLGGFAIGITVAFSALAIGPLTGAMLNPARAIGPEIVAGSFANWYVWWIGPIVGGALAALAYRYLIRMD